MIKSIFFDLDRTLLNRDKRIPNSSATALRRCKENGIKLFVATARPPILDKMLGWGDEEFSLFDGGVYCNGGCIKFDNQMNYTYIPSDVVSYCISAVEEYDNLNIALQMKNERHAFNHFLDDFAYDIWGIEKEDSIKITEACYKQTVKILIYYENMVDITTALPLNLIDDLQRYCNEKANFCLTDSGKIIQISSNQASKFNGVEKIRKHFGFSKLEVAAFGDDMNDFEMLNGYENSVAMDNADARVKAVANFVTKSNDADGIAYALKELLKII